VVFGKPKWRPDGKQLACRCVFVGGRVLSAEDKGPPPPVAGEELVVIFTLGEATPRAISVPPNARLEGWEQKAGAAPAEQPRP
ncbi:MAG TPA: hypothetical protein PKD86_02830, partial [Gemmatales bacterium]|nr:hypothetical protein [Gemmatales bacterium]